MAFAISSGVARTLRAAQLKQYSIRFPLRAVHGRQAAVCATLAVRMTRSDATCPTRPSVRSARCGPTMTAWRCGAGTRVAGLGGYKRGRPTPDIYPAPCTGTRGLRRTQGRSGRRCCWVPFLAGVLVWALGRGGPWVLRLSEPGQQRVRLAALTLDTAVGALGIAVLGLHLGDRAHLLGWTIGGAVSLGSILYAAGLFAWRGDRALGLRVLG